LSFSLITFVFLAVITVLFFSFQKVARPYVLLAASLIYIFYLDRTACTALLTSSAAVYGAGLYSCKLKNSGKEKAAGIISSAGIILLVLFWGIFRILPRVSMLLASDKGIQNSVLQNLVLPMGYSYYMFQAISYLSDIRTGKNLPERNIFHFLLYMCFFPKFISGPIERADSFLSQLKKLPDVRLFDEARLSSVLAYVLYGYFMKIVVADRLGMYLSPIFSDYHQYTPMVLIAGALLYSVQIYCDFAGYSALAVGIARLFGIDLTQNFLAPYISSDISDFWRRWHRSLSMWLRDYVYIPLGGNRKGKFRQSLHSMAVFLICGLWHGKGLNFLVWGFIHGIYTVVHVLIRDRRQPVNHHPLMMTVKRISTFVLVTFAWIFFGASGLRPAVGYIKRMITGWGGPGTGLAEVFDLSGVLFFAICFTAIYLMDKHVYKKGTAMPDALMQWHYVPRYIVYLLFILVIFVFGIYGPGLDTGKFMYMTF